MEKLLQDVRFAARLLWKDRGFATTALLTLGLCIGANAAIYAVVHAVVLRPLPFAEPDRLVTLYNAYPKAGIDRSASGVPDYYDRLREMDVFEELALLQSRGQTIGGDGAEPQRVMGLTGTPSLFRLLRIQPFRGRIFTEAEGEVGKNRVVLLSYALWQESYGGRDSAVGETLRINGIPHAIVGVLPRRFSFVDPDVRLWTPLAFTAEQRSDDARHSNNYTMIGRLKPAASVIQAQQQLDALNARNLERFPNMKQVLINAGFHSVTTSYQQDLVKDARPILLLLWAGVAVVLLIGAVNITNLVLIRSSSRMRELATRHALGAGQSRLARQLITETVLLTIAGGALGLGIGAAGLQLLTGFGVESLPRRTEIAMDVPAVLFTLALALVVGLIVGLVPVLNLRHMNLSQAFREEGRSGTSSRGARAVRRALVACQVAFALVLLIGAGLLLASFERVLAVKPGFDPDAVLVARVSPPATRYKGDSELLAFADRLLARVRAVPGVKQAGIGSMLPFDPDASDSVILAEGYQMAPGESVISPYRVSVTPGYFESLGVPLKAGRLFTDGDTETSQVVAIVDERLARKFWPGQSPIGRRMFQPDNVDNLTKPSANTRWITVVGVVGDTKMRALVTPQESVGSYFFPVRQSTMRNMGLTVKAAGDPLALVSALRAELRAIDPELPLYSVRTVADRMHASVADRRTPMVLAVVFAVVALFLAAIGLYGVLAYQVSQRTREIGIRMALGSDARAVFALVLKEGVAVVAAGAIVGLAGAFAIRRTLEAQLFGVGAMDPFVLGTVAGTLAIVALAACAVPARRAARISPIAALTE
jgi:putative ABC transport system permease protein